MKNIEGGLWPSMFPGQFIHFKLLCKHHIAIGTSLSEMKTFQQKKTKGTWHIIATHNSSIHLNTRHLKTRLSQSRNSARNALHYARLKRHKIISTSHSASHRQFGLEYLTTYPALCLRHNTTIDFVPMLTAIHSCLNNESNSSPALSSYWWGYKM